jgi:asparagine synthase (glutamine-hydrolysing)
VVRPWLNSQQMARWHEPLFDSYGNLVLVANGEIYNYRELSARLEKRGCRFLTKSDTETILHAYAVYGSDLLRHMYGMYAFALYDKSKQKHILERNRLGIKPLYYLELPGKVAFASKIKALLPVLQQNIEIECEALVQFLENEFSTSTKTITQGISRVLPGEIIEIDARLNLKKTRYWSTMDVPPTNMGFNAAFEQFDVLMKPVIQDHLHADVPFGLFLSGGVDSSILAVLLSRYHDQPLRTFSVGYRDGDTTGEIERAKSIARRFNTDHTTLTLSGSDMLNRIPHMIWTTDELMFDTASLFNETLVRLSVRLWLVLMHRRPVPVFVNTLPQRCG